MKIGIITFHKSHNYGTLLQAYALKSYLRSQGHTSELINYWPKYRKGMFDTLDLRFFSSHDGLARKLYLTSRNSLSSLLSLPWRSKRISRFNKFIDNHIISLNTPNITSPTEIPKNYDKYIFGSDQIWRFNELPNFRGFDEVYWGHIPQIPSSKKIAYAASMGKMAISNNNINFIKDSLSNFSSIAVRENDLREEINQLAKSETKLVLDPVFLLPESSWREMCTKSVVADKKYILLYNLTRSKEANKLANNLAIKNNCRVIEICGTVNPLRILNHKRYQLDAGPQEFLSLIQNADYVVSTSFHGVAFSILFEKQFFSLGMGNNSSRVKTLLDGCDLSKRYLDSASSAEGCSPIDYNLAKPLLLKRINQSREILKSSISMPA